MQPGEYLLDEAAGDILANAGRATTTLIVQHTGDRPIQVGSHYHFVAEIMTWGASLLPRAAVMEGVAEMVHEVQVEATFPDGTKLVTLHDPIR